MPGARKRRTTDEVEIPHRQYYRGKPKRLAGLKFGSCRLPAIACSIAGDNIQVESGGIEAADEVPATETW